MIKELGVVREPRGLSWQNWATSCKDVLAQNRRYLLVGMLLAFALLGGGLYLRSSHHAGYAKQAHHPQSDGTQLNLNDTNQTVAPAASAPQNVSDQGNTTSGSSTAAAVSSSLSHSVQHGAAVIRCDQVAAATARLARDTDMKKENIYHQTQMTIIKTTGIATMIFDRSGYDQQLAAENARHDSTDQSIDNTLAAALSAAHC